MINNVVRMVKRPTGRPDPSIFEFDQEPVPSLKDGEFLMRNTYLSMDPALVSRMRDEDNYAEQVDPGDVMHSYGLGQVIESKNREVKVGEIRLGLVKMQEYCVGTNAEEFNKLNLGLAKPTWYLNTVGSSGATAFFSFLSIGKPQKGETVLISAGASSVGVIVAQIAKSLGCRVVGIVSTDAKAQQAKHDWGYDEVISYRDKSIDQLSSDIAAVCPNGVDIYYDNTSGDISEAVLDNYCLHARWIVIGRLAISHLADTKKDVGRRDNNVLLTNRVLKQGFVLLDYRSKFMGAFVQLATWMKSGELKLKEDILEGIERSPDAFFAMLEGRSNGRQLVKLADIDESLDPSPQWLGRLLISRFFPTRWLVKRITGLSV